MAGSKPTARAQASAATAVRAATLQPLEAVRQAFKVPKRHRDAVAAFFGVPADDPAVVALIAVCIEHNVSPFLGHFFLREELVKQRNAAGKLEERYRLRPAAGRDGFLAVARASGSYRGMQFDVVCGNDHYGVDWTRVPPSQAPRIRHQQAKLVPGQDAADARAYRGPIVGAWAKAWHSDGLPPTFYYAALREHGRVDAEGGWADTWSYTSAMIDKCAQSYVLRIGWGITGVLPVDELRVDPERIREEFGATPTEYRDLDDVTWPEGELGKRLRAAVERANELDPNFYTPANLSLFMDATTQSEAELTKIAEDIEKANEKRAKGKGRAKRGGKS